MKTFKKIGMAMLAMLVLAGCGSNKKATTQANNKSANSPFGEVFEAPCTVYDTDAEFTATGIYRGSSHQLGEVHKYALQNAQEIVRLKIKHAYKGMVSDFSQTMGNNSGNDLESKISSAGDRIIDVVVNNTSESCLRWGEVESDGHVQCYVAIKISKVDLAQKIAAEVENKLTDEEKMKINFDEKVYREQMEKRFEEYKERK